MKLGEVEACRLPKTPDMEPLHDELERIADIIYGLRDLAARGMEPLDDEGAIELASRAADQMKKAVLLPDAAVPFLYMATAVQKGRQAGDRV